MKIGFDAKRAVQNYTGLGNYSRFVIEALSEYFPDNEYVLFAPKKKDNDRLTNILSRENIAFAFPMKWIYKKFPALWRTWGIRKDIAAGKIDIYHGLSNEIPLGMKKTGVRTIVTIHDLIFLRHPECYRLIDRLIYRWKFGYACRNADLIIAVSECTKRDIIHFFGIPENKIKVIYQSCRPDFKMPASIEEKQAIAGKYRLPERFLLYTGSIEPRKNLLLAVKALKQVPEEIHLVAVGKPTSYQYQVERYAEQNSLQPRLHILNSVPSEDLPALYQSAEIFLYPSRYEGFGIPVIEALTSGTPVIAAKGSCLEEAGGADSIYVNPDDADGLALEIRNILGNKDLSNRMVTSGKNYVSRFDTRLIAGEIMGAYEALVNKVCE